MKQVTIDWNIMSELGLVEKINREVLHPIGLAISYDPSTGISEAVLIADDLEWEYAPEIETTIKTPEHIKNVLENLLRCGEDEESMNQEKTLQNGKPVTEDHRDIKENGQQKDYVVLSEAEREKGFVRPVRRTYVHNRCGVATTIGKSIAETYARDPSFYSETFCIGCKDHFPLEQFKWDDGSMVGS